MPLVTTSSQPWQGASSRSKSIKSTALLVVLVLVICLQMAFLCTSLKRAELEYFDGQVAVQQRSKLSQHQRQHHAVDIGNHTDITLVGISYSDESISEAAIRYLIRAACDHHMESYIFYSTKSKTHKQYSLGNKIYMMVQHLYMPLGKGGTVKQPTCSNLIHIRQTPSDEELIHETRNRMNETGELKHLLNGHSPNNPLDPENRIARIKRVREHQRQMIRSQKTEATTINMHYNTEKSIIAVLDLDMFDYPPLSKVIQVTQKYMRPSIDEIKSHDHDSFDVICSNGLQRSRYGETRPHRNYYDTFATILLPNTWPVLESTRTVPRGQLPGEDVAMSQMSQQSLLNYFLSEGSNKKNEESYEPVPVRSCFGGFTLYRANVWLRPDCRYDLYNKSYDVYRGKKEHHTCEHVVFHECLRQKQDGFAIAVQPDMVTLWHLM
eukprot:scaffold55490_cov61-Cyclotella_meneghiniana.AAC.5